MLSPAATQWLSYAVLCLALVAVVGLVVTDFRRQRYTPGQYHIFLFNRLMARLLWRAKIIGRLPLAAHEGAVIVCNHMGPIDPSFIALATDRAVHWMIAREFCELRGLRWFFRTVGAIPTSRGGIDIASTKQAIRYAQQGDLIGLFPEGRINDTGRLLRPGRPGAALIALRAQVPVIPCYLTGSPYDGTTFGFLIVPTRAVLRIGKPIDLSPYYDRAGDRQVQAELTKLFLREIAKLAGVPNFEPELAGRNWKTAEVEAPSTG